MNPAFIEYKDYNNMRDNHIEPVTSVFSNVSINNYKVEDNSYSYEAYLPFLSLEIRVKKENNSYFVRLVRVPIVYELLEIQGEDLSKLIEEIKHFILKNVLTGLN